MFTKLVNERKLMKLNRILAAFVAATLGLGGAVVATTSASAHTGDLKATAVCNPATGQYDVTYTLNLTNVPNGAKGTTMWRVGNASFQGTPNNANDMDRGPVASTGNTVLTLGTESIPGNSTSSPWVYAYTSWDNGTKRGSDGRIDRLAGDCRVPDVAVPIQLTYMEGCPVDQTNTWRFRNTGDRTVTVRLSDGNTHQATVGDSIYKTDRFNTTLTAQWGGPGTGVKAGQTVKASGKDKAFDNLECTGPQPETKVKFGNWIVGEFDCDDIQVTETRTVTTTTFALNGSTWVGTPVVTSESFTRDLTAEEIESLDCPVDRSVESSFTQATCELPTGSFEYEVTVGTADGDRTFQVKSLGDGTGGDAETFYRADGTTGAPGEIVTFASVAAGESATLALSGLEPGDYRVVSDGNRQIKALYQLDFTINDVNEECAGEQPDADVVTGDWVTGEYDCDDTTVIETRTVTTTPYVLGDREWVAGEPTVVTETRERDLTEAEIEALDCPEPPVVVPPVVDVPDVTLPADKPAAPTTPVAVSTPVLPVTGPSEIVFGLGGLALLAVIGGVLLKRREALQD